MQNIMDSMFYPNCPFEIDGCKVYYKSTADKLCNITIDNDISQIMVFIDLIARSNARNSSKT